MDMRASIHSPLSLSGAHKKLFHLAEFPNYKSVVLILVVVLGTNVNSDLFPKNDISVYEWWLASVERPSAIVQ